jgi:hypothetical protein
MDARHGYKPGLNKEESEATEQELSLCDYVEKAQHAADNSPDSHVFLAETEAFTADLLVPYSRRLKILQFVRNIACKKNRATPVDFVSVTCGYARNKTIYNDVLRVDLHFVVKGKFFPFIPPSNIHYVFVFNRHD